MLLTALLVTSALATPARAEVVGDRSFLIIRPSLTWPCEPQGVYLDTRAAPSASQVAAAMASLERFRSATRRPWPLTSDPGAPIQIRWFDPDDHFGALTVLGADEEHYRGAEVQLSPHIPATWLYSTLLHELGHVGGLGHVRDPIQVMGLYPSQPHERYEVGDLVGLLLANRGCDSSPVAAGRVGLKGG